jgi:FHS family L-fucose permease-like MFS transporter
MKKFLDIFRTPDGKNHAATFALVCTLFFMWGLCSGMLDTLSQYFKSTLHVTNTEAARVPAANYTAYFLMAVPAGLIARRFGYKGGILTGLGLIIIGSFCILPASHVDTFTWYLLPLFILALGLACLETIANPYTTILGSPEKGAVRINMAQTCNGLGWIMGPTLAAYFAYSGSSTGHGTIYRPYLVVAAFGALLFTLFLFSELPDIQAEEDSVTPEKAAAGSTKPLWQRWHFMLAILAQFLYVAAQTGIFFFFQIYVTSHDMPALSPGLAGHLPASWVTQNGTDFYITKLGAAGLQSTGAFVLFLSGRFLGSLLLRVTPAHSTLAVFAVINSVLMLLIVLGLGWISAASMFLSFFFMSIMFPTIFALGIRGLGDHTKLGSSLIVMSIVGGAIMPTLLGWLADMFSMRIGFVVPLVCFICIAAYAAFWPALERLDTGHHVAD